MNAGEHLGLRVTLLPNAVNGGLSADKAGARGEAQRTPACLSAVRGIDINIDQASGRGGRFDRDRRPFGNERRVIDCQHHKTPERIERIMVDDGIGPRGPRGIEGAGKERRRPRRGFVGARNIEREGDDARPPRAERPRQRRLAGIAGIEKAIHEPCAQRR